MIALMDCNNFFASCERVFDLTLRDRPLVVLSNNDGCVIARSNESKELGLKTGDPYFKIKKVLEENDVAVRSSNYELYADISRRIMSLASTYTSDTEIYSIDELFLDFPDKNEGNLLEIAKKLRSDVLKQTSIPTSIGFSPTKTLSKIASRIAKKQPNGIFIMPENTDSILSSLEVSEVWGIGKKTTVQLTRWGIKKAIQLRDAKDSFLTEKFSVNVLRTAQELRGINAFSVETQVNSPQSISCSRMFGRPINDYNELFESISTYIGMGCEKLRSSHQHANGIHIYFQKSYGENDFDPRAYFVGTTLTFQEPLNETHKMIQYASTAIRSLFEEGARYRKSGITFIGLQNESNFQADLFSENKPQMHSKLYKLIDQINHNVGKRTLFHLAEGINRQWEMRREWVSPRFTTQWNELPKVK